MSFHLDYRYESKKIRKINVGIVFIKRSFFVFIFVCDSVFFYINNKSQEAYRLYIIAKGIKMNDNDVVKKYHRI